MSATLLADRSVSGSSAPIDTDHLAPVVPIRRPAPVAPVRPARRTGSPAVSRRAGSRGPRYLHGSPTADWRLSRRGELLLRRLTAAVTAVVVVLLVTAAVFAVAGAAGTSPVQTRTVVVQPGDSLWRVSAAAAPSADVSDIADQIRSLNHLGGTTLTPGQTLLVPVIR